MRVRWQAQDGAIPFVIVGVAALGGVLGLAWSGHEWSQLLVNQAGGELTVWVLRGAFWALDLVALQASAAPTTSDWYTPIFEGPALPIYALAALVMVATLIAETIAGVVTGNTTRIVQAVIRALIAGMLATVGGSLLLAIGGALSDLGRIALDASGTGVDAPLIPLQEVLMDTAEQRDAGAELFIAFLAGLVIVFTSLAIYFTLAMRPVLLAVIIVFLPVAHALSVWTPLQRIQVRTWALAFAVLLADAAILTMFAVTNTVIGQPEGVDRLIFGTFGLLLAALAPAALARVIGVPELHTAVQSMSRGSRVVAAGAGVMAAKGALMGATSGRTAGGGGAAGSSALATAGGAGFPSGPAGGGTPNPGGGPSSPGGGSSPQGGAPSPGGDSPAGGGAAGAAGAGAGRGPASAPSGSTAAGSTAGSGAAPAVGRPAGGSTSAASSTPPGGAPAPAGAGSSGRSDPGSGGSGSGSAPSGGSMAGRGTAGSDDVAAGSAGSAAGWSSALTRQPVVGRG